MKTINLLSIFLILTLTLASCGGESANELTSSEIEALKSQDTLYVTLNSNDMMQFDLNEINAIEGQTIVLNLVHTGTMPVTSMGHNFVLITNDISISQFAKEAYKADDNEYIPVDGKHVIAHTKLIGGGESDEITFEAPAVGVYDFLCSFPGHYSIMKGKFNVLKK